MLDNKGFDLWANGYDKSVNLSDEENTYPFAGYKEVLNKIYGIVHEKSNGTILDIGFGTGVLTQKLYNDGYTIYGIDFSEKMIEIARSKMPTAVLLNKTFPKGYQKSYWIKSLILLYAPMLSIIFLTMKSCVLLNS